jgi:FkbH-like protein
VMFVDALQRTPVFERLSVSAEDTARTELYRQERRRKAGQAAQGSVEDFLRALEMSATIDDVNAGSLARVAQLTQKTNQFNVTTRRYSEEQVSRFAANPGAIVRTIRVADRYGDSGLVGVLMARINGERCEIDTLLLSCRVIGRGVETLMLSDIGSLARSSGARVLAGRFIPTPKNAPAQDIYLRHGFVEAHTIDDGTLWELDLTSVTPTPPDHINVRKKSELTP